MPTGLLAATIAHIAATTADDGAILAFLPGLDEIIRTRDALLQGGIFGLDMADKSKFKIYMLHSTLPKQEQQEIFETLPPGRRKIILSTNIAETSVTVTDVKYVVDTGKLRESRYDQLRRITKLQCVWESKSNSKQRMGRAGRVRDGFYYALFSKERADSLRAVGLPELLRSDLQETCLSVTSQKFDEPVASFLAQAIEPPSEKAVTAAIKSLIDIEAYTADERLTSLGRVLSSLLIHPTLGKMIFLGVIFKCLDPVIALGAAAEDGALFVTPIAERRQAAQAHKLYAPDTASDHLAHLAAFRELRQIKWEQGLDTMRSRAREQFLHIGAFRQTHQNAQQIVQVLADFGLIDRDATSSSSMYGPPALSINADNSDLIKSLILAGSHPNLAVKSKAASLLYRSPTEADLLIHPSSVNKVRKLSEEKAIKPANTLFTFSDLSRSNDGSSLYLRNTTKVTPLMVALSGGKLQMVGSNKLQLDDWLPFVVQGSRAEVHTKVILEFRKALERVLHRAYASHADFSAKAGQRRATGFADDPIGEKFAQRVVQVLTGGPGDERHMNEWRDGWRM